MTGKSNPHCKLHKPTPFHKDNSVLMFVLGDKTNHQDILSKRSLNLDKDEVSSESIQNMVGLM